LANLVGEVYSAFRCFSKNVPYNISVPSWAYFDVNSDPNYSPFAASSSAVASTSATVQVLLTSTNTASTGPTAAPAIPISTITPSASEGAALQMSTIPVQITSTDTSTPSEPSSTSLTTVGFGSDFSQRSSAGHRTAAIAGGTVAALLFLAIGAALAYWWYIRQRRTRMAPSAAYMAVHGLGSW